MEQRAVSLVRTSRAALAIAFAVLCRPLPAIAQTQAPALQDPHPAGGLGDLRSPPPASLGSAAKLPPGTPTGGPPPPLKPLQGKERALRSREKAALAQAQSWVERPVAPAPGPDGLSYYSFGATRPTLVCAPLMLCRVQLQEGEMVQNLLIGDPLGWVVDPGASGEGVQRQVQVVLKPAEVGLHTNLIISTSRRTYDIALESRRTDAMVGIAFHYPTDQRATWTAFNDSVQRDRDRAVAQAVQLATAQRQASLPRPEAAAAAPLKLWFGYEISGGKPSWRPVRVYDDGRKTYIEFPAGLLSREAPAFVGLSDRGEPEIRAYRKLGDLYVVDQVIERGALLVGVGHQQVRVDIRRSAKS